MKNRDSLRCLGVIHTFGSFNEHLVVRFLADPGPVKRMFRPEVHSTDPLAEGFPWCAKSEKSSRTVPGVRH